MNFININDRKLNCLKWGNESYSHAKMKFDLTYYLSRQGWSFYTECRFTSPYAGRCDVLAFRDNQEPLIIEVLETEEKLKESKKKNYPQWEIITIKANQQFNPELLQ